MDANVQRTAFVTGADRGLGLALCAGLLDQGWRVFAGQYMPDWPDLAGLAARFPTQLTSIPLNVSSQTSADAAAAQVAAGAPALDLLINNAGILARSHQRSIRDGQDFADMHTVYDINALGPLRVVEAFMPLLEQSAFRRLCFISSEAGSIGASYRTAWFGYCMSKAALNMAVKNLFNELRPAGYTFRLYHPGWMRTYMSGEKNMQATLEPEEAAAYALDYFLNDADEDRLVLRDYLGKEYPW